MLNARRAWRQLVARCVALRIGRIDELKKKIEELKKMIPPETPHGLGTGVMRGPYVYLPSHQQVVQAAMVAAPAAPEPIVQPTVPSTYRIGILPGLPGLTNSLT